MPRLSHLVCATERSGTTLLCELLGATGVAGRPEEYFECLNSTGRVRQPREYFDADTDPEVLALLPSSPPSRPAGDWHARLAWALERGTTSNGVFGAKMMWAYLPDFLAHGEPEAMLGEPLRWVHVDREDKLAQAVSLWRAVQTEQWRAEDRSGGAPVFHAGAIAALKRRLEDHAAGWREWFAARRIDPLEITYEELAADPHATVCRVLDHLGLDTAGIDIPAPPTLRQADSRSQAWVERFRAQVPSPT
jgi:trehalose 2-sulfotransferase